MSFNFQYQPLCLSIFNKCKYTSSFDLLVDEMFFTNPVSTNYHINNSMNNAQNTNKVFFVVNIFLCEIK